MLLLSVFLSPSCRWRRAPELGGAANVSRPQSPHLSQRHHPHTQVLPHLLRQRERRQATVQALLSEADPAHRLSAAQDLPSSHQNRLHKPNPPVVLAARHSAGGSQLPDWWWGRRLWVSVWGVSYMFKKWEPKWGSHLSGKILFFVCPFLFFWGSLSFFVSSLLFSFSLNNFPLSPCFKWFPPHLKSKFACGQTSFLEHFLFSSSFSPFMQLI